MMRRPLLKSTATAGTTPPALSKSIAALACCSITKTEPVDVAPLRLKYWQNRRPIQPAFPGGRDKGKGWQHESRRTGRGFGFATARRGRGNQRGGAVGSGAARHAQLCFRSALSGDAGAGGAVVPDRAGG